MLNSIIKTIAATSIIATASMAAKPDSPSVEAKDLKGVKIKNLNGGIMCIGDYAFFSIGPAMVQLLNKSGKPMGCEEAKRELTK